MSWFTGTIVYVLTWWIVIFMFLPLRIEPNKAKDPSGGLAGAPDNPHLKYKFGLTTLLSAVIWLVIYGLIEIELIDFRAIAKEMHQ